MTQVYTRDFRWNEDVVVFARRMLASMYGQSTLGERTEQQITFEMEVIDERFEGDRDLPYDGYAEVVGGDALKISGYTDVQGTLPMKEVTLPMDVLCRLTVWTADADQ